MATNARIPLAFYEIAALLLIAGGNGLGAQQAVVGGHVRDAHQVPVAGAEVILLESQMLTLTDSAGAFHFCAVAGDSVQIVARAVGFRSDQTTIVLSAGAIVMQDLTLISLRADEVPAPSRLLHLPRRVPPPLSPCDPNQ